jgi:hypothetical protein
MAQTVASPAGWTANVSKPQRYHVLGTDPGRALTSCTRRRHEHRHRVRTYQGCRAFSWRVHDPKNMLRASRSAVQQPQRARLFIVDELNINGCPTVPGDVGTPAGDRWAQSAGCRSTSQPNFGAASLTVRVSTALDGAHTELDTQRTEYTDELTAVERELAKTEAAIDRYLTAFENGTMSEDTCAPRVEKLASQAADLRARRDELGLLLDEAVAPTKPGPDLLDALRDYTRRTIQTHDPDAIRELLYTFVHEVRVTGRHLIKPTFRIPTVHHAIPTQAATATPPADDQPNPRVRTLPGSVPPAGFEPATYRLGGGRSIP